MRGVDVCLMRGCVLCVATTCSKKGLSCVEVCSFVTARSSLCSALSVYRRRTVFGTTAWAPPKNCLRCHKVNFLPPCGFCARWVDCRQKYSWWRTNLPISHRLHDNDFRSYVRGQLEMPWRLQILFKQWGIRDEQATELVIWCTAVNMYKNVCFFLKDINEYWDWTLLCARAHTHTHTHTHTNTHTHTHTHTHIEWRN